MVKRKSGIELTNANSSIHSLTWELDGILFILEEAMEAERHGTNQ